MPAPANVRESRRRPVLAYRGLRIGGYSLPRVALGVCDPILAVRSFPSAEALAMVLAVVPDTHTLPVARH
jgi:hypothetical protein